MVSTAAPPRIGTERNPSRPTLGGYVADVGLELGYEFHEWQRLVSDVSMELVPRGTNMEAPGISPVRLNAQYVGCMVGRQSGKTSWAVSRVVAQALLPSRPDIAEMVGLTKIKPQEIAYTAQTRTAAVERWLEHVEVIEQSPLASEIANIRLSNGRELLVFKNGSRYRPLTPSRTASRGLHLDLAMVDEALAHPLWLLPAIRGTQAQRDGAAGCIGAQFVIISNAGDDDSELLNRMQELGHQAIKSPAARHVWLEWSAPPECDPFDEAVWYATMPTLGQPNGIDLEFMRTEAETLRQDQFLREYLCVHLARSRDQLIPTDRWMELIRPDVLIPYDLALGLDVTPDRQTATLMACGPVEHYLPIELVEARQGLEWIVPRTVEVANRWSAPVAIDEGGPAAPFIPALEAIGIHVIRLGSKDVANAAAMFYDAVMAKRVTHQNDYQINDAVTGASRRAVGDRWAFDRRGHTNISPLVAASFALWAVETGQLEWPDIS